MNRSTLSIFFSAACILVSLHCGNERSRYFKNSEANIQLSLIFSIKNQTCGGSRSVDTPFFGNIRKEDIHSCLRILMMVPCTTWVNTA
ncbi:MAG TPA: hypothetical protein PK683_10445, partial [Leptospiraceae bacterium]|nr:hypothetical protein [Leptospiraceae bacterium]